MIRLLALILCLALPATAQVVGTAIVDGKKVQLFADQSWRYAEALEGDCRALNKAITFCGNTAAWQIQGPPSAEILAQFARTDSLYGQFIWEDLGAKDGMTIEFIRKAVLANAAAAIGGTENDVPVIAIDPYTLGEMQGETIVYGLKFDGLDVVYANSVFVSNAGTAQVMTYAVGETTYTDQHKASHQEFLDLTKLDMR